MRYYIKGKKKVTLDLIQTEKVEGNLFKYTFLTMVHLSKKEEALRDPAISRGLKQITVFVKKILSDYFVSTDQVMWKKLRVPALIKKWLVADEELTIYRGFRPSQSDEAHKGELIAEMPGRVVKVLVKPGDKVSVGSTLLILEAMKMENEIKASKSAQIKIVHVKEGQTIEAKAPLLELEDSSGEGE